MSIVVVWGLLIFLTIVAGFFCFILCLILRGNARSIALDVLLSLGTAFLFLILGGNSLPLEKGAAAGSSPISVDEVHQADVAAAAITAAEYSDKLSEPWKTFAKMRGHPTVPFVLTSVESALQKFNKMEPNNAGIASRWLIVVHESGGDIAPMISKFEEKELLDDPLVAALDRLYSPSVTDQQIAEVVPTLSSGLPRGWYRQSALEYAYKKSAPIKYAELQASENAEFQVWSARNIAYQIGSLAFLLFGTFFVFRLITRLGEATINLPDPVSYGFRKWYACFLSLFAIQALAPFLFMFCAAIVTGVIAGINNTKPEMGNLMLVSQGISVVSGTIAALAAIYFIVCKPAGVSLKQAFLTDRCSRKQLLSYTLSGFAAMVAVVQISILLMRFIMNQGIRTSNPVTLQLLDSILTKNIGMLAFLGFFMCIVAPITEELIFRGLMYPWLRQRWGVAVGIIVSSLLFSAVHLDFPQFLSLLGLGAVLALVFEYTRSLRVTMIMHAMWNAWTVLGALAILPR